MLAFIIWSVVSFFLFILGIITFFSKKCALSKFEVKDINSYNKDFAKLIFFYAIALEIVGLPLLNGQNSPEVFITVLGTFFVSVFSIMIHALILEPKHRK